MSRILLPMQVFMWVKATLLPVTLPKANDVLQDTKLLFSRNWRYLVEKGMFVTSKVKFCVVYNSYNMNTSGIQLRREPLMMIQIFQRLYTVIFTRVVVLESSGSFLSIEVLYWVGFRIHSRVLILREFWYLIVLYLLFIVMFDCFSQPKFESDIKMFSTPSNKEPKGI